MNKNIAFRDLGLVDFKETWDLQDALLKDVVGVKVANREREDSELLPTPNHLLFCEHPPVYTLGKTGSEDNLLIDQNTMDAKGIQYYHINRGGDITFHGPGQIIGYPILDLDNFFTDIHKYLRYLEEAIILTLSDYGIVAGRLEGATGVWIDADQPQKARKICAMGIRSSRWVTMHGWAFNVNVDLNYFKHIVPCGIEDKAVTSMQRELGVERVDIEQVKGVLKNHFYQLFEAKEI